MNEHISFNLLLSNILDGRHYSHCRLCLKFITEADFVKLEDSVSWNNNEAIVLAEILERHFNTQVSENIPGIDAVCSNCLREVVNVMIFVKKCEQNNSKLNQVLKNLNAALNSELELTDFNQKLYINCDLEEIQLILTKNEKDVKPPLHCECFECDLTFTEFKEFEYHNLELHNLYTCDKCLFTSAHEQDISNHKNREEILKCSHCKFVFCTKDSFNHHTQNYHTEAICEKCNKVFLGLLKLQAHEEKHHKEDCESVNVCKYCGKSFSSLNRLLSHEERHNNTKTECPKCGKKYKTKLFYDNHVKLCLLDQIDPHPMRSRIEKTYVCQKCGKSYSTPGGLNVHYKFAHGNAKPHVCDQCNKQFSSPCYLKAHKITHTKEKNFPCTLCERSFVTKEALLYHTRRHTGERPYACDICDERFVNSSARAEHIKHKHIGPTICCELCPRKFVTKNLLKLHMKKHYDPTNRLYIGRTSIPPNVPSEQNMRIRIGK